MTQLHHCHRGHRCTNHQPDPEYPDVRYGAPINAAEGLCDACTRHLERAIVDLPRDYVDLETALHGTTRGLRQLVSGTPELPTPPDLTIHAQQEALLHEAQCWAESTADRIGVEWDTQDARDSRPGAVLQRASQLLSGALSAFLALRDVVHIGWINGTCTPHYRDGLDGADTLLNLQHRTRALTGHKKLVHQLPVPCPHCERSALTREDGDDTIECAACALRMTWEEYERSCTLLAHTHLPA